MPVLSSDDEQYVQSFAASEILKLTTASRQGKLQNPEELLPQVSATPGVAH
jgi:hypothetical protein